MVRYTRCRLLIALFLIIIPLGLTGLFTQDHVWAASDNLLVNASFEDGSFAPDALPTGWSHEQYLPGVAQFTWDDTSPHSGSKSVKISTTALDDARWIQVVDVQPNTDYVLAGWLRTENVVSGQNVGVGGANLSVESDSNVFLGRSEKIVGTTDWRYVRFTFNSGAATQVKVGARLGDYSGTTTGTAWFDDLQLQVATPTPVIVESSSLTGDANQSDDRFGTAIAIASGQMVIGAPFAPDENNGMARGAAYLFTRNQGGGAPWTRVAKLMGPTATGNTNFGTAVGLSGDLLVVSDPLAEIAGQANQGAVYAFLRNGANPNQWDLFQTLVADDGAAGDNFGRVLAIADQQLLVGAGAVGKAYLFAFGTPAPGQWTQIKQLTTTDPHNAAFGTAVALQTGLALVGSPANGSGEIGAAYLFAQNQGGAENWGQVKQFIQPSGSIEGAFGSSVVIIGQQAFIGSPNARKVYSFARNQGGAENWGAWQTLEPDQPITFASRDFGSTLAFHDNSLFVGMGQAIYIFTPSSAQPDVLQPFRKLTLGAFPCCGLLFYSGLAADDTWAVVGMEPLLDPDRVYLFDYTRAASPIIRFAQTNYTVSEGVGTADITVTLDQPNPYSAVSVDYDTQPGEAFPVEDYTPVTGTLVLPQNAISATIHVPITNDALLERTETFRLSLRNPVDTLLDTESPVPVTIADDDHPVCDFQAFDEASWDRALRCVSVAGSGVHTITVTANISFTQPAIELFNPEASQIVIEGNGHTVDANGHGRVLTIRQSRVAIHQLTLRGGRVPLTGDQADGGGAIKLIGSLGDRCGLTLDASTIEDNEAETGGAIRNVCDSSIVTISNSLIRNNHALAGGAIIVPTGEELFSQLVVTKSQLLNNRAETQGGAIYLTAGDAGTNATISDSTIAGNTVVSGTGGGITVRTGDEAAITNLILRNVTLADNTASAGGGLFVLSHGSTNVTVGNSTISGNRAISGTGGGVLIQGAVEFDGTDVRLINSTVANNTATAGGGIYKLDGLLTIANTLVVSNTTGDDCQLTASAGLPNRYVSGGHNLDSDGSCLPADVRQPSDIPNGNAVLGPRAENGGPTFTHALLPGSQAIDAGDDTVCAADPVNRVDQRGVHRPQGTHCDIGAFELEVSTAALTHLFVSSRSSGRAGNVTFRDEDIVTYNATTNTWQMLFDGSDVGVTKDVNAFTFRRDGSLLLSFNAPVNVPGLGQVDDSDIVQFNPTKLGSETAGSFAWYLHGADVGLTTDSEDIDAIGFTPDDHLVVSTIGDFAVSNLTGKDEDLIRIADASSGGWSLFLDGSAVGLANEDVNGLWIDSLTGQLYLTVKDSFAFGDLPIDSDDIFVCTPTGSGANTTCTYARFWDSDEHDYGAENLDAIDLGSLPPSFVPSVQASSAESFTPAEGAEDDDVDDLNLEELNNDLFLPILKR